MQRPGRSTPPISHAPGVGRATLRTLTTAFVLAGLLASGMPAAAKTDRPGNPCTCAAGSGSQANNPTAGKAVINDELSEGDEVVVEFVPSDLPAASGQASASGGTTGDTTVDGGNVSNDTSIAVDASGGDADSDASGGDLNLVEVVTGRNGNVNADAGSGGDAASAASGGTVVLGNINSGNNQGSQISVDQVATGRVLCFLPDGKAVVEVPVKLSQPSGDVAVDGGNVTNDTNIAVDASGGNASADASGGSGNVVIVNGGGRNTNVSAGSGGNAAADASGGTVDIGNVNSGGNTGNDINVNSNQADRQAEREQRRGERRANRDRPCLPPPCVTTNVAVNGGNVSNETDIAVDASGGDAAADASGGDDNTVEVANTGGNVNVTAGTGGNAASDASGGVVEIGNVRSGGNTGNDISVDNVGGQVLCVTGESMLMALDLAAPTSTQPSTSNAQPSSNSSRDTQIRTRIDGGNVSNETDIAVDASGGTSVSDASGGDGNTVIVAGRGNGNTNASAGNGGNASSDASGGTIVIGDINSGGNSGNDIDVNDEEDEED